MSIVKIIMRRDGLTRTEAEEMVMEARQRVRDGEDPKEILYEDFELEPDYVMELL